MRIRAAYVATLVLLPLIPAVIAQNRRGPDPATRWERMKRFDADGDGVVTRKEFPGPARVFERMDRDGDGMVTKEEVAGAGGGSGRQGRSRESNEWVFHRLDRDGDAGIDGDDVKRILSEADADGDGTLSKEEFLRFLEAKARAPERGAAPDPGAKAPGFELRATAGGPAVTLAKLLESGRPVMIAFGSFT